MNTIALETTIHDNERRIKLMLDYNDLLISKVKKMTGGYVVINDLKMVKQTTPYLYRLLIGGR